MRSVLSWQVSCFVFFVDCLASGGDGGGRGRLGRVYVCSVEVNGVGVHLCGSVFSLHVFVCLLGCMYALVCA